LIRKIQTAVETHVIAQFEDGFSIIEVRAIENLLLAAVTSSTACAILTYVGDKRKPAKQETQPPADPNDHVPEATNETSDPTL
jgi:hypothetical protein